MGATIKLGKIFGIPLGISYSWFLVLGLVTYVLGHQFGESNPGWSPAEQWTLAGITSILFFVSVLVHELSHSILAVRQGIPVKGIALFIFGGVSQIAREADKPSLEFYIAAVGPLSSLVLGALFLGAHYAVHDVSDHLAAMAGTLALINFLLGIFNMLPGFPLDGGRVLRSAVWAATGSYWKATNVATRGGQLIAMLMVGGGLVTVFRSEPQGIWVAAVGWFLFMTASASRRQFQIREQLKGYRVGDLMTGGFPTVPSGTTIDALVSEHGVPSRNGFLAVTDQDRCLGLLSLKGVTRVGRSRWHGTTVDSAMRPVERFPSVSPSAEASQALERMEESGASLALVLEEGRLLGFFRAENALRTVRQLTRRRLGSQSSQA